MKERVNKNTAKFLIFVPIIGIPAVLLSWTVSTFVSSAIAIENADIAAWAPLVNGLLGILGLVFILWLMTGLPYGIYLLNKSESIEGSVANVQFHSTSGLKVVLFSIATFGIYDLYWCYKNWEIIKKRDRSNISPFWRAFFMLIFVYPLFDQIKTSIKRADTSDFSAGWMAILLIFFALFSWLSEFMPAISILSYFTFIPLVVVQNAVNEYNLKLDSKYRVNRKFSIPQSLIIALGFILILFSIFGTILLTAKIPPFSS